jgi:hypothetical protein
MTERVAEPGGLVDASGRPLSRHVVPKSCPGCGAGPERRDVVAGFGGTPHDVCQVCGHEFSIAETQRR